MSIDELFCQSIDKNFRLDRQGRKWTIEGATNVQIHVPTNKSVGFCLEDIEENKPVEGNKAFPFFGNPPEHVAKMCDGIIALSYKDKDYIFMIELKSGNTDDYKIQIKNGQYFCEWLLTLFEKYCHYEKKVHFIGLLCYKSKMTKKDETGRNQSPASPTRYMDLPIYKYRDQENIDLINVIKAMSNEKTKASL